MKSEKTEVLRQVLRIPTLNERLVTMAPGGLPIQDIVVVGRKGGAALWMTTGEVRSV